MGSLRILEPGALTLIEDLGRPGHAAIGLSRSGALDRGALRLANRLVGNDERAAGLEILFGGLSFRTRDSAWIAVTGARGPVAIESPNGAAEVIEPNRATLLEPGDTVTIGLADHGLRFYLSVRGGIATAQLLGSSATDQLSGLGPAALAAGDELDVGSLSISRVPAVDFIPFEPPGEAAVMIRLYEGPRADWFTDQSVSRLYEEDWVVAAESNRIGVRLSLARNPKPGENVLVRSVTAELPSEAMVPGAIQVSPSGQPTVLLADHPVTGGYPVIAVVADTSLDAFAQLRPGQRVSFRHA
jgi:biotin-dependent carboxylase-like uncharacterized protein